MSKPFLASTPVIETGLPLISALPARTPVALCTVGRWPMSECVAHMQQTTLEGRGISPEPFLVGSDEFWNAIDSGELRSETIDGRVSAVFMSGHNDYPECTIETAGGETFDMARYGPWNEYAIGDAIRVHRVELLWNPGNPETQGLDPTSMLVLRVWIEG